MSKVVNGIIILEPTEDAKCEFCGKIDELRPYGPNDENICYECGMKDKETVKRKIEEHLFSKARGFNPRSN